MAIILPNPLVRKRPNQSQKMRDKFNEAKENINKSYLYFKSNYERYNKFMYMTFVTTLTDNEKQFLQSKNRPPIEFNIMHPYISRLRGEFAKSQFGIKVGMKDGRKATEQDVDRIKFLEGYLNNKFHEMKVNGIEYEIITKTLAGGFAGAQVYTDYINETSFNQEIFVDTVFDPTLMGFDPLSKKADKSDGAFFYCAYPQNKKEFQKEHPDVDIESVPSANVYGGLQWSYHTDNEEIILIVDYYYKKYVRKSVVLLSDDQTMTTDEYEKFKEEWKASGKIAQVPSIAEGPETRKITKICRYKMIGNQIIEEEETKLKSFPYIYIDGNSELIKNPDNSHCYIMTRPYLYDAVGTQKMKNFAGQSLLFGMLKMIQSPFMASAESLRGRDAEPWRNPQDANVLIYNAFKDNDPNVPLQPPIAIAPQSLPPENMNVFKETDATMQNILGSFDANMARLSESEMSGKAYQEVQTMSNAAAKPYIESMTRGMQAIAERIVELLATSINTKRNMPVRDAQGRVNHIPVNQEGGVSLDFKPGDFDIKIEAGVSFSIQQNKALQQITALANSMPMFGQFINDVGLPIILDNVEIRGVDQLKVEADKWMQQQAQMKEQMMQQPNPEVLKLQVAEEKFKSEAAIAQKKMENEDRIAKIKALTEIGKIKIDKESNKIEAMNALANLIQSRKDSQLEEDRLEYDKLVKVFEMFQDATQMSYDEMERNFQRAVKKYEVSNPRSTNLNQ